MKTFAENLKHARIERGLSQEQLAKLIGVKSGSVIYNWESCGTVYYRQQQRKCRNRMDSSASYHQRQTCKQRT